MLKIENLHAYYGTIEALKGISLEIRTGEITCLVGSNGAGKTTLLKSISGATNCTGSIQDEDGQELLGLSPQKMAHRHIIHVPEGRHIFPGLTVRDNLEVGTINWHGFWGRKPYDAELEEVFTLFPRLKEREKQLGWSLSGGEQQMLAVGRALMSNPKLLMLDEPSLGLAPIVVREIFDIIRTVNQQGITVLLNEQNANMALKVADYAYVLETGTLTLSGTGAELLTNEQVKAAYLGKKRVDRT